MPSESEAKVPQDAGVQPEPVPAPDAGAAEVVETPRYPFHDELPPRWLPKDASAMRNANLSPGQCQRELVRRKLPTKRARGSRGVAHEVRLDGPMNDVRFFTAAAPSPYGRLDCRLALALADFAELLREHDVVSLRIDNMYRPGAKLPGRRTKSQHSYGLAIDITSFMLSDGTTLSVEEDWGSEIGSTVCGPDAVLTQPSSKAVQLRNLVCAVARAGIFHHLLTPSHDAAHSDHLHFDIKRDEKSWMLK